MATIDLGKKPTQVITPGQPDGEELYEVKPVGIRMRCPECKLGEMFLDPSGPFISAFPPQFPHVCNKCGFHKSYTKQYPGIMFQTVEEPKEDTTIDEAMSDTDKDTLDDCADHATTYHMEDINRDSE